MREKYFGWFNILQVRAKFLFLISLINLFDKFDIIVQ